MMNAIKYTLINVILLCVNIVLCAQSITSNEVVRDKLNAMFDDLDKTKIPTGYLLDYAMDLVEFDRYNGMALTDSNFVTLQIFEELLLSINSASVGVQSYEDVSEIMKDFTANKTSGNINIAYLGYKYNFIKEGAVENNLICFTNDKVTDVYVDGVWQNPYGEAYVFGFTPSSSVCNIGTVNFEFSTTFAFFNISRSTLKFDAGDGAGYRGLSPTHTISVNYTTPGKKELKFYIKTTDGVVLETHSSIYVLAPESHIPTLKEQANIVGKQTDSAYVYTSNTYTGSRVGAQVTTYLRRGNTTITKPFIVVEGFDPWRVISSLDNSSAKHELGSTHHRNFMRRELSELISNDYDFIYIDWLDSTEDIRDNAYLLIEIIRSINRRKVVDACTERTIIMGQSMGGLVTRVALCMMEKNGESHEVSTYVSHDTPHLGANVPLGALYFVHHLLSYINGYQAGINLIDVFLSKDLDDAKRLFWEMIHSPAVKQMLVNHLDTEGILDNSVHDNWQELLGEMGFPQGDLGYPLEKLAIVNGAINHQSDIFNLFGLHYLYLEGYAKTTVLTDIISPFILPVILDGVLELSGAQYLADAISRWGSSKFEVHAEVNPFLANNTLISDLRITYTKKYLWRKNQTYTVFSDNAYSPPSGLTFDSFSGSTFSVADTLELKRPHANTWFYKYDFRYGLTDRIMFIPSASALAMYEETEINYHRDYYLDPPVPELECPFDAYSLTDTTQSHIKLNNKIFNWLRKQLSTFVVGDNYAKTGSRYSVNGYYGVLNWNTSDRNIATIDNSGILTAHGNGIVSIIAEYYDNGQLFRKTKDVIVNFPDIIIRNSYVLGEGYQFVAESVDANATQMLEQLIASEDFLFEWTFFDSNGTRTTQTSQDNKFRYLPKANEAITIAVRLVSADGRKGPVKSVSVNLKVPFSTNYTYVVVTADQDVYFIKNDGTYERNLPIEDFSVMYNYTPYSSDDNIYMINDMVEKYIKGSNCFISYPYNTWSERYLSGTRYGTMYKWSFPFFDMEMFLDSLDSALLDSSGDERTMYEFNLTICNSLKEKMQKIPFVIIYKPIFPET